MFNHFIKNSNIIKVSKAKLNIAKINIVKVNTALIYKNKIIFKNK